MCSILIKKLKECVIRVVPFKLKTEKDKENVLSVIIWNFKNANEKKQQQKKPLLSQFLAYVGKK